jgi:Family of unknown function (DUF6152)
MPRIVSIPVAAVVLASLLGASALAHHSFAMFDSTKIVTLTGTIKELQWAAPHVLIWLVEDPKAGEPAGDAGGKVWSIELSTSPGPLSRLGWTKRSVVPGDRVTVDINPLRNGEPGGSFKKSTILATGQVLVSGSPGQDPPAHPSEAPAPSPAGQN